MNKLKRTAFYFFAGIILTGLLWTILVLSFTPFDNVVYGMPVNIQVVLLLTYLIFFLFIGIFIIKKIVRKDDLRNSSFFLKCSLSTMLIHTCAYIFMYYLYTNRDWGIAIIGVYVGLAVVLSIIIEIVWMVINKIRSRRKLL